LVEVKPITIFFGSRDVVFFCCEVGAVVVAEVLVSFSSCGTGTRFRMLRMSGLFIFWMSAMIAGVNFLPVFVLFCFLFCFVLFCFFGLVVEKAERKS